MESEKIVFKQSKFRQFAYRRVKIGLIGEGQIHGEDDAISMRPYQASLRCTVPNSEVLVLARETFKAKGRARMGSIDDFDSF